MKISLRLLSLVLVLILILVACSVGMSKTTMAVTTVTSEPVSTFLPTQRPMITPTATIAPTLEPTMTPVPVWDTERQQIRAIMGAYGQVNEKVLTEAYWGKMAEQIAKYGEAKRILTLEYHGDNYNMYDGAYAMTPEQFEIQMRYLLDNDYHFVTGPELVGFLEGWLTLPARAVILTTDSGGASYKSIPRISALFSQLETEYGVAPQMLSFIWTASMDPAKEDECKNDACWQIFRTALATGYFTFGTHTETHRDFATLEESDASWDIQTSIDKIQTGLGVRVYSLSWPFESCSTDTKMLNNLGIKYAFGGSTRAYSQLFTYAGDDMNLCLPRLFPPNPVGYSGRPSGWTLEQMLTEAMTGE